MGTFGKLNVNDLIAKSLISPFGLWEPKHIQIRRSEFRKLCWTYSNYVHSQRLEF